MSLKQEIETWVQALAYYDNNDFDESLKTFDPISDTSKILFNCGVIQATLGEHGKAVECYQKAVRLDQYFAVAYFQQGVSNFLVGDFEEALVNFNDALLYLRGNTYIDYEQLGLKFKLYSCEVLFNRGLCYIYLQQKDIGLKFFQCAVKEKVVEDHNVIDEAILEEAEGYTVFSIPVGVVYRPNSAKVNNLKTKDYLGKARLVAASDLNNAFTGFTGSEIKKAMPKEAVREIRPAELISFAASNLVKPELRSRSVRQQSEPPLNRTMFPLTPPPESDRAPLAGGTIVVSGSAYSRPRSSDSSKPNPNEARSPSTRSKPDRLDLSRVNAAPGRRPSLPHLPQSQAQPHTLQPSPHQLSQQQNQQPPVASRPRLGTIRTASEPRGPSRAYLSPRDSDKNYRPTYPNNTALRMPENPQTLQSHSAGPQQAGTDAYPDDLDDMYRNTRPKHAYAPPSRRTESRHRRHNSFQPERPRYIEEEAEDDLQGGEEKEGSDSLDGDDENDFEMVSGGKPSKKPSRDKSRNISGRSVSRRPEILKQIRLKVHVGDDTRYIMLPPAPIAFPELMDRVMEKFALQRSKFKCRIQDDGDMITLGDQDDLDMAVQTAKDAARREGGGIGKVEIWVHPIE